jgi:GNAT superfamily N-acetyltransferase
LNDKSQVMICAATASQATQVAAAHALLDEHADRMHRLLTRSHPAVEIARSRLHLDADATFAALSPSGHGVGIGRYRHDPHQPATAEVGISVVDDWRRRGVGRGLLTRLAAHASRQGIRRFTSLVSEDSLAGSALLRSLNAGVTVMYREIGVARLAVPLPRFCNLCGRTVESADEEKRGATQVCGACVSRYLPKVQARLAGPWWS